MFVYFSAVSGDAAATVHSQYSENIRIDDHVFVDVVHLRGQMHTRKRNPAKLNTTPDFRISGAALKAPQCPLLLGCIPTVLLGSSPHLWGV